MSPRLLPLATLTLLVGGALAISCRDDVAPFEADDRPSLGPDGGRLTSSTVDDRAPAWSPGGDSIYYVTEGFGHLPTAPGVLVGLPREGGTSEEILTNVQLSVGIGTPRWLTAPSVHPTGDRLAFIEVAPLYDSVPCPHLGASCDPDIRPPPIPPLRQVELWVRSFDATGDLLDDPSLRIDVPGVTITFTVFGPAFDTRAYPFQQLFNSERALIFRPSWSPDGEAVVTSDGLQLLVWSVAQDEVAPIPSTDGGAWPAWSPDGEWIAFSRLLVVDSTNVSCIYPSGLGGCTQERVEFIPGAHLLSIVRPDGSDLTLLGEGDEPAWSPDGSRLFFRRDDGIWSIPLDGGSAVPVPHTEGGREPAVSPDGLWIAFAKRSADGDYDIWVVGS